MGERGRTEQVITLYPSRGFATEFFPNEVDEFLLLFQQSAERYLSSGHVISYEFFKEPTKDGRVIVKVIQNVA
jgi:hypothetical protein